MGAGSGSFIANSVKRRETLAKTRSALLDQGGLPSRPTPPPVVPAQDKTSPQQKALRRPQPQAAPRQQGTAPAPSEAGTEAPNPLGLDEETKAEFMAVIQPVLDQERQRQRAKLHKVVGRARRFFGGGF